MTVDEAYEAIKVTEDFSDIYDILVALNDSAYDRGHEDGVEFEQWNTEDA